MDVQRMQRSLREAQSRGAHQSQASLGSRPLPALAPQESSLLLRSPEASPHGEEGVLACKGEREARKASPAP